MRMVGAGSQVPKFRAVFAQPSTTASSVRKSKLLLYYHFNLEIASQAWMFQQIYDRPGSRLQASIEAFV